MSSDNMSMRSPRCLATTDHALHTSVGQDDELFAGQSRFGGRDNTAIPNLFKAAQFTADGTSVITHSEDHGLRTYILPSQLLDDSQSEPCRLEAANTIASPTPVRSFAPHPTFNIANTATTVVLSAPKDLPIVLQNVANGAVHAKYPLVSPTTEEFITPHSLLWTSQGTRFVAGSKEQLSVFDASRDSSEPIHTLSMPGRKAQKLFGNRGPQFRGIVTALSASPDGTLAAGTTHRQITILEHEGYGGHVASFALGDDSTRGTGITQLAWSPCGRYLVIAERQSDCIQVYDMRNTLSRIGYLSGRTARKTQRMAIDVVSAPDGFQVWAGGTDGFVRMWGSPGSIEGERRPDEEFKLHDDAVSSVSWHPTGAVFTTTCGQRHSRPFTDNESDDGDEGATECDEPSLRTENTLKVWGL